MTLGQFGVTVASLWGDFGVCEGHFGHAIGSPWVTLGVLFALTVGALWGHLWVMMLALGDLEGALGSL